MLFCKKNIAVALTGLFLFVFAYVYLHSKYTLHEADEYVGQGEPDFKDVDLVDYHFLATNFAFTGRFPVTGYILPEHLYKISSHKELNIVYLDMFRKNGPVTSFMRAPLYPLLIGCIYKVFGFKYYYNLRINILLLSLIIGFMPLIGSYRWGLRGYLSGVAGALIFLQSSHDHWFLNTMDVDIFSSFVYFFIFLTGLIAEKKDTVRYHMIWGVSIGLGILTKPPLVALLPLVYAVLVMIWYRKASFHLAGRKLAAMVSGIILIISPWTIYINYIQHDTISERQAWCQKVSAGIEKLEISGMQDVDLVNKYSDADQARSPIYKVSVTFFTNIVKNLWLYHSRTTSFIFVTNGMGDIFLHLNNEYCTDGGMHYEWMFIKSSFYRSHCTDDQSTLTKTFLFYYYNPSFIYKIPIARIMGSFSESSYSLYWLVASLWGICVIQLELYHISNKKLKLVLTLLLLFATVLSFVFVFIPSKYIVVLLFMPVFCSGIFLFKDYKKNLISIMLPLMWISLFMIMFFILPYTKYMTLAMPISCIFMVYFSLLLAKGFRDLALGTNE